jgi:hypothetical protein
LDKHKNKKQVMSRFPRTKRALRALKAWTFKRYKNAADADLPRLEYPLGHQYMITVSTPFAKDRYRYAFTFSRPNHQEVVGEQLTPKQILLSLPFDESKKKSIMLPYSDSEGMLLSFKILALMDTMVSIRAESPEIFDLLDDGTATTKSIEQFLAISQERGYLLLEGGFN